MTSYHKRSEQKEQKIFAREKKRKKRNASPASRFKRVQIKDGTSSTNKGKLPKIWKLEGRNKPYFLNDAVLHDSPLFLYSANVIDLLSSPVKTWPYLLGHL